MERPDVSIFKSQYSEVFVTDVEVPKRFLDIRMKGWLNDGKWVIEMSIRDNENNIDYVIPFDDILDVLLNRIEIVEETRFNH